MKVKVLYACEKGKPDYYEQVITEVESQFKQAIAWCKINGLDRIHIREIDLSGSPDFIGAINGTKRS